MGMKKTFLLAILIVSGFAVSSQTAPLGKDLIKSFSERMQSYETIQADFTFTLENLQEGISDTHKGKLSFKGKKYFLDLMGMEVYFDGTTKWQFIPEVNEVTISKPSSIEGGFFEDPTKIFNDYEQDFKSRYIGESIDKGVGLYEVDLYPEDLSVPYSSIKIIFKKQNLEPVSIKYQSKDGINYIIKVNKFKPNASIKDQEFSFDLSKYKKTEVIDLR